MRSAPSTRAESETKDETIPCAATVSGPDNSPATNDVVLETVEEVLLSDKDESDDYESDGETTTADSGYDTDFDSDDEEGM